MRPPGYGIDEALRLEVRPGLPFRIVNGSVVRTSVVDARGWRMRQWPNDPTVAHLIFVDHHNIPTLATLNEGVEHARRKGARAVRTSALFPDAAAAAAAAGFSTIDRLSLLQRPLSNVDTGPRGSVRNLRSWQFREAAEIDRRSFGPLWGNDARSLRDIRRATPAHWDRMVRNGRRLAGFALSGAARDVGYLQRVAVAPDARRQGRAKELVLDALEWMADGGRTTCLVNTGVDNAGALALYESLGFRRLDDELTIAELRLT